MDFHLAKGGTLADADAYLRAARADGGAEVDGTGLQFWLRGMVRGCRNQTESERILQLVLCIAPEGSELYKAASAGILLGINEKLDAGEPTH